MGAGLVWIFLGGDFLVGEDAVLMEGVLVERFIVFVAVTNTTISPMVVGGACVRRSKMTLYCLLLHLRPA